MRRSSPSASRSRSAPSRVQPLGAALERLAGQPRGAGSGECPRRAPRQASQRSARSPASSQTRAPARRSASAERGQRRRRLGRRRVGAQVLGEAVAGRSTSVGRVGEVHADADRQPEPGRSARGRSRPGCPRALRPAEQHVVRPFQRDAAPAATIGVGQVGDGQGGDEGDAARPRPAAGRWRTAGCAARLPRARAPGAAAPARARRSARAAVIHSGPVSPALGAAARLGVGGVDLVERRRSRGRRSSRRRDAQISPNAAAAAAPAGRARPAPAAPAGKENSAAPRAMARGVDRGRRRSAPGLGSNHIILTRRR